MPNVNHPKGVCPKCNGSKREHYDNPQNYRIATFDKETSTIACRNCGGQTMSLTATGEVLLRPDGTPCTHSYEHKLLGNCWHGYTCKHCGDKYDIDSGD